MSAKMIPKYSELMLPLLQYAANGDEHHIRDAISSLADYVGLTDEQRQELLPNGKKIKFDDRVQWANTYLKKAGLLESVGRGLFRITDRGYQVLQNNPGYIDNQYLMQFPEFVEFSRPSRRVDGSVAHSTDDILSENSSDQTPEELLERTYQQLQKQVADELLDYILDASPQFFERLVIDLLLSMGYGGSLGTGRHIGRTADGGVDGYIEEDKLGLDTIYIQAKRWARDQTVGRPDVQGFVGSLMGYRATKGVFMTTSRFSQNAIDYAGTISNIKVILIDGKQLTRLMLEHNVGVSIASTYHIMKIDKDYFEV